MSLFVSLDSPEMQQYLETLSSDSDPFEIVAEMEEEDGRPLVYQITNHIEIN